MTADRDDATPAPAPAAWAEALAEARRAARVAAQNDAFRRALAPGAAPCPLAGRAVLTQGIAARGPTFAGAALLAVAADETFTTDNDPYGHRDFGAVEVEGVRVWWRIDLYDADERFGSERPEDPAATVRVLTILLPEEW